MKFNAYWLRELGGSFLLVENTPNLLLLHMGLLEPKMGEKNTPANTPELLGRGLVLNLLDDIIFLFLHHLIH